MKIKKILVSQPSPAALEKSPFNEIIAKYGVTVDFVPFIRVESVSLKEFRSQRVEVLAHTAIIFTSRTTIDHFFHLCDQARVVIPETMKYLCNSETVALYLQKYIVYRKRKIFFANGTTTSLMELILRSRDEKLLLTLSEPYSPELTAALDKLGVAYDKMVLSHAVSAELNGLDLAAYDMLVYYSPLEIAALKAKYPDAQLPYIATFGHNTAKAAVEAGLCVSVMAPTEQAPSMTKAIDLFVTGINSGGDVPPVKLCDKHEMEEFLRAQQAKPFKKARPK